MSVAGLWLTAFAFLFFCFSVALPTTYEKQEKIREYF